MKKRNEKNCEYNEKLNRHRYGLHRKKEFEIAHRRLKQYRPFAIIFTLIFIIFLFQWLGVGAITILFGVMLIIREVVQMYFVRSLQKRIFEPIYVLKHGIEEVAKGNYDVTVETSVNNELKGLLISFEEMVNNLQENEKLKREYEENRKNLIANISHDLKTPMTSIQGYMEAIDEGLVKDEDTLKRYNQIILNNVNYTTKLIDDLFLFSKLDLDKIDLNASEVNAGGFLRDIMDELKLEVEDQGFVFNYMDNLEQDTQLHIDGKRIYQSIRNIVGNALKYGQKDDLQIECRSYSEDGFCYIEIEDNGPGIPEDQLDKIFERFYRIDESRTKDTISTGLGLAIAKELIEVHHGKVEIQSKLNEGTTIIIKIPIVTRSV